ncbi:hypothetical protein [Yoonia sediminilitoris]|uniref:Uncharacterized protein n=1 Tax=Yoonia sediminilitoris TaxID=1286148 RepID=A0A2T6KC21_9RHOB|nr:hypothetical protein [Yoonia sediminilitoris]PUB12423.1 hypothetical protein C8N45_11062 [Yoonia sediminilitoris]RCW93117.1 hypothetical protein DFP92_11062 [Yoonia sediminilitoris]
MVTKSQRILDLLPGTFAAEPAHSPLVTLAQTYGSELQEAENALAAIMRAHWCDQADLGASQFDDLPKFAALYGLSPHPDDGIEEFRRRLKLWVRLILDGPATVRGLLRASSILTGLEIDDSDAAFDAWWRRDTDRLTTTRFSGRDAGPAIFGFDRGAATGADAAPARITGAVRLPDPLDLGADNTLRIAVDGGAVMTVDFSAAPAVTHPQDVIARINETVPGEVATLVAGRLVLTSPTSGNGGRIAVADGPDDAAARLLGLPPRRTIGTDAQGAVFTGTADLSGGIDLSENRFVRLTVDGTHLSEIDCAGATPAATLPGEIVDAINAGLGLTAASHDGHFITLASPTTGIGSTIAFLLPAAQDATKAIFGPHPTIITGKDAEPATLVGTSDLALGADLSAGATLLVAFDGEAPTEVNCAGDDPTNTQLPDVVSAINATLRADIARHNGRNLILNGLEAGPAGLLELGDAGGGDAALALLGLPPRQVHGTDATRAILRGQSDLTDSVSLAARPLLRLAIDHRPAQTFDLSQAAAEGPLDATGISVALNAMDSAPQASAEDGHLVLQSPTDGAAGRVELVPVSAPVTRRFVSRVPILEDAAQLVFGTLTARAAGSAATAARITGTIDLRRGVDLSGGRFVRLAIDGGTPVDIDCAGPRPRTTTAEEVISNLNSAVGTEIATLSNDGKLLLTSPTQGAQSQLSLSMPQAADALGTLTGAAPQTIQGRAAQQVSFTGTADLSAGIDLSAAAHLRLAIDAGDAVEIDCAGPDPAATTLAQIVIAINVGVGQNVATHDGAHILLTSPTKGAGSSVAILTPASADATKAILGIAPERQYSGAEALAAELTGSTDISGGVNLSVARFLRLGVGTTPPIDIDCAAETDDPAAAAPEDIVAAINAATSAPVASIENGHLVLRAPTSGASSRLVLETVQSGDAQMALLGTDAATASGEAAQPAKLVGTVDLRSGVDLSTRSVLRLAVNDGLPIDIDIAGTAAEVTSPEEVTAAINAQFPAMAAIDADGYLSLTARDGETIALLPLRYFEVIDYPPEPVRQLVRGVSHGDAILAHNTGAAAALLDVGFRSAKGVGSPGLINLETGWQLRLRGALQPGMTAQITSAERVLSAVIGGATSQDLPPLRVEGLPLLPHLRFPADTRRTMAKGAGERRQIVITGPAAPDVIQLSELRQHPTAPQITIAPAAALPDDAPPDLWIGRLETDGDGFALVGADGTTLATIDAAFVPHAGLIGALVAFTGQIHDHAETPLIMATSFQQLVDLTIHLDADPPVTETFTAVTIAATGPLSMVEQINTGPAPSTLVLAKAIDPTAALELPRGKGRRLFVDCLSARYDAANFDRDRFAGGPCLEQGIFNVSRFAESPKAQSTPVFAPMNGGGATDVTLSWENHAAAAAEINLPLDMPARFGARFDMDRFALSDDAPETITGLVTEPAGDPDHFVNRLAEGASASVLVTARAADTVPIGFAPVSLPFARPVFLSGGSAAQPARLYLSDPGVAGFIALSASVAGKHGNRISVVVCDSGPGRFDLLVAFDGARFENARQRVMGPALTGTPDDLSKPGPRGAAHLKAAGVRIAVTRDGTPPENPYFKGD